MLDRITFNQNIMNGKACIRGMRIPVSIIVTQIAHGASFDEILKGYPDLELEDIQQAILYAAWLTNKEFHSGSDGSAKKFDCVKMKNDIQKKIQDQTKGMTPEEEISFFRKAAESNPIWAALKKKTRKSRRPLDKQK